MTVLQLLDALERDYQLRGLASLVQLRARAHLKHIKQFFGNDRALEVTPHRVHIYMERRQQDGAANATINREVEGLQRVFALAVDQEVLTYAPRFKSLPEHNARQGFFERADFEAILPRLMLRNKPDTDLQDFLSWCFWTGIRTGETKALTWADFAPLYDATRASLHPWLAFPRHDGSSQSGANPTGVANRLLT